MEQILFLAPSQCLAEKAGDIVQTRGLSVTVRYTVVAELDDIVSRGLRQGVKVLISRGGMAYLLKEKFDIPVVDVDFTSSSYIQLFKSLLNWSGPVAFFSIQGMSETIQTLCYLLHVEAHSYQFHDEQSAREAVQQAVRDGNTCAVGGALTAIYAKEMGLPYIELENTQEEILHALGIARTLLQSILAGEQKQHRLQFQLQRYEVIFNYTHDGIIAVDRQGRVEVVNRQAEHILPLRNKPYEGKYIEEILPSTKIPNALHSGVPEIDELMKFDNTIISTNRVPIIMDGQTEGVVATFRDIDSIRMTELKIRSSLSRKGLVSRYTFNDMLGESKAFIRALHIAKSYARTTSSVLILGEIGTGKEMFAHAIHHASNRRKGPFVTVNCANLSASLLRQEILGYEKNASPFADQKAQAGAFELAHGGTIFLDNAGDAPREIQSLLVQILETREVRRIGGSQVVPVNVRIIASAKPDIAAKIKEGAFLEELIYMLSVLTLQIPPLRERGTDYQIISEARFRRIFGSDYRRYETQIQQLEASMGDIAWDGNIRQLFNLVERSSVLLKNGVTVEEILTTFPHAKTNEEPSEGITLNKWTRSAVIEALRASRLNISQAARMLDCSRSTLYKRMKELDITIENIR